MNDAAGVAVGRDFLFFVRDGYFFNGFGVELFLSQSVLIDHYTDCTETSCAELDYALDISKAIMMLMALAVSYICWVVA